MSNTTFRIFNPLAPKEDRVQKRRAQLRQAQHNYRERREKYLKDLEEDVSSSRAREARLLRQNKRLSNAVQALTGLLQERGGTVPPEYANLVQQETNTDSPPPVSPSVMSEATTAVSSSVSPTIPKRLPAADVDLDGLGVEFVLALERPCWRHIHGDPDKPDDPSGHTLTASSQVCAISSPSCDAAQASTGSTDQQQIPAAMLENLLKLSQMLNESDREVTPVQAWHYLRSQYQFGKLELESLLSLAQSCTDAVKCHGFGAVIDQNKFKKLASSVLQQRQQGSLPQTMEDEDT
ncbi:hypothetical protein BD289DRAFT_485206 [Coniella lustricola]|uniref:BZIP domain-containing protein n=1 Tax=Coniella lustricola TaxID=2025994 RepID=A0A2T2ZZH8_9PEZI|nr:hypothetical protein BD289DRAFT_485206 [Coniella lustricola]